MEGCVYNIIVISNCVNYKMSINFITNYFELCGTYLLLHSTIVTILALIASIRYAKCSW